MGTILQDLTPVQKEVMDKKPESKKESPKTLEDWQKLKSEYTKELNAFKATEKIQMSREEAREFRKNIRAIRAKIGDCRVEIVKLKQKKHKELQKSELTGIALKQSRFLILLKQGYSISNITLHSDGVSKKDIENIMTEEFIADCERTRYGFRDMWGRWKEKYLK